MHATLTAHTLPSYLDSQTIPRPPLLAPPPISFKLIPPVDLKDKALDALVAKLFPIYLKGFMHDLAPAERHAEFLTDLKAHLGSGERVVVCLKDDEPCAFMVSRCLVFEGKRVFHLQGIIVDPAFHGTGLAPDLLASELRACKSRILAFHTQSGRMQGLAQKVSDLVPDLGIKLASLIGTRHQDGVVDRGRYGGHALYGDRRRLAALALRGLDVEQGDALIGAGYVKESILQSKAVVHANMRPGPGRATLGEGAAL